MRNIFSANEEPREVDPAFQSQADAQRGGPPSAPPTNDPFPAPMGHPGRTPGLEKFFEGVAPGSAVQVAPPMPETPHLPLRPDFERLAERSAPFSLLK